MYILLVMQIMSVSNGSQTYGWTYLGTYTDRTACEQVGDDLRKYNSNGGVQRFRCEPVTAPKD